MRLLLLLLLGCPVVDEAPVEVPDSPLAGWCQADPTFVEERVEQLLAGMDLSQKIGQLAGVEPTPVEGIYPTPGAGDLPGLRMIDGPRGVSSFVGPATAFPVGSARGATWDPELERRVGRAMGAETAAYGANVLLAPTVNVLRHPRWGRGQETYGEDPLHVGLLGAAFIEGAQEHVIASVKHFAANSIENSRFSVDVLIDDRTLREVYLPAFSMAVDAGVGSVMSAYNSVNGAFCSENAPLLRDVLKDEWGFLGFVESDWYLGTHDTEASLRAGLDLEMPFARIYGEAIWELLPDPELEAAIDDSVRRILRTQLCFGVRELAGDPAVIESEEHLALAREVATRATVLLKNSGVLPLDRGAAGTLALLGPLADVANIGDTGSSAVAPSHVVTLAEALGGSGWTITDQAVGADVAVVVVGLTSEDEGEYLASHGDRDTLRLHMDDELLISQTASEAPTIVVLQGGSAITVEPWLDDASAVLHSWYPGSRGGEALADLLFGIANPSGRLPISIPVTEEDLPPFDNEAATVVYDRWHGHRHLLRAGVAARFPFGFGLSYTDFQWADVTLDGLSLSLSVRNTGVQAGIETVQVYAEPPAGDWDRGRELVGWVQVALEPGEEGEVRIDIPRSRLAHWDAGWVVPPGTWTLVAARHAEDPGLRVEVVDP